MLTVRASTLSSHPGEVALPGGKCDPSDLDDHVLTASREAEEEIGLQRTSYSILSTLPPIVSRSGYLVTPVLARLDLKNRKPSFPNYCRAEVAAVFDVPLEKFIAKSPSYHFEIVGDGYPLHCVRHSKHWIAGLTCNILVQTASIAYGRLPEFDFDYDYDYDCDYHSPRGQEKIEIE